MNLEQLKNLLNKFGDSVKFEHDLKKKIGLISGENQKFFIKLQT